MNLYYKFHVGQVTVQRVSLITDLCMATLSDGKPPLCDIPWWLWCSGEWCMKCSPF